MSDPEARAAYDAELKRRRAAGRTRNLKVVATGMTAFEATLSLIPMVVLLQLHQPTLRWRTTETTASDEADPQVAASGRGEWERSVPEERPSTPSRRPSSDPR